MFGYNIFTWEYSFVTEVSLVKKLLIKSSLDQKPIEIIYFSKNGEITHRLITVRSVNDERILALCHVKKQYRTFLIEQILAAHLPKKSYSTSA